MALLGTGWVSSSKGTGRQKNAEEQAISPQSKPEGRVPVDMSRVTGSQSVPSSPYSPTQTR